LHAGIPQIKLDVQSKMFEMARKYKIWLIIKAYPWKRPMILKTTDILYINNHQIYKKLYFEV